MSMGSVPHLEQSAKRASALMVLTGWLDPSRIGSGQADRAGRGGDLAGEEGNLSRKQRIWWTVGLGLAFAGLTLPIVLGYNWPGEWTVVEWALRARSPICTSAMQAITFFGSAAVGVGVSAGLSAMLFVSRWAGRPLAGWPWLPLAAMVGSAPLNFGLRAAIGRYRPGVTYIPHRMPELWHPFQQWSYPSGHAMTATICYGAMAYVLGQAWPKRRRLLWGLFALWVTVMGFSRVYLGVHWPSDVLAGCLIGGAWLCLCVGVVERRSGGRAAGSVA
jgi:membrane-associated phospholipid phosphatase